ncbi:MAG: phytanoyl-CoA dioxygenase family protein [Pseudomonadota bacterium]
MRELSATEIEAHIDAVAQQGYTIMTDAIDAALLQDLHEELERLEQVRPGGDIAPAPFTGFHTRRWFDLLNDGAVWQRVAVHPWVLAILPGVLGENFLLSTMGTAVIGPGEAAQSVHCDDMVYMFPRPHPNLVCNTMWALSDFTANNGATRIVPGSNNLPDDPVVGQTYNTVALEMPAGSIALVVGTCYHGAGANITPATRWGLTINYCNGRMRQQENLMLGVRPERMMGFAPQLQDLLGFKICQGAGHIFANEPRVELTRRYDGQAQSADPYLERRDALQAERLASRRGT